MPTEPTPIPPTMLDYAPVVKGRALRRWVNRLLIVLAIGAAAYLPWYGWQWRLKQDEKAFNAQATINRSNGYVFFNTPPTAAALRHLQRVPNIRDLDFIWSGNPDPAAYLLLRGRRFPTITTFALYGGMDADGWLKELSRADTGLKALTTLNLYGMQVTDAGLKDLARPDSGLKALTTLDLWGTQVTDAGLKELARPATGLKALTTLYLSGTKVTGAGLKELARPDTGLKALTTLYLDGTQLTNASLKELARPDTGLKALTTLYLSHTKVTDAEIAALKAARPGLEIVR